MKGSPYPEYAGLFHASKILGRPVKWTDDRSRQLPQRPARPRPRFRRRAGARQGRHLPRRAPRAATPISAPISRTSARPWARWASSRNLAAIYRTPLIEVSTKVAFTHTSPIGAYRGAGRPEANYFMERLIDTAAREMGIDQVEMRQRNHIKPEEMPYKTASGTVYDSGEFTVAARQGAEARRRRRASPRARQRARRAASCAASASATISK